MSELGQGLIHPLNVYCDQSRHQETKTAGNRERSEEIEDSVVIQFTMPLGLSLSFHLLEL